MRTIYPPVAEAYFLAVDEASPAGAGTRPMQAAAGLAALAVAGALLAGLRRLGRDPRSAGLWAWCPTVAFEAGNDAHIAAGLAVASLVLLSRARGRRRAAVGGSLLCTAQIYGAPAVAHNGPLCAESDTLMGRRVSPAAGRS